MSDPCLSVSDLLRRHQTFLVLTHYRPDGDAVGSQLALTLLLQGLGKQVAAWNDDPVPGKFRFLPHSDLIQPCCCNRKRAVYTVPSLSWSTESLICSMRRAIP